MALTRRSVLAGLGAALTTPPAWAQAIGPQSDPWAQVDPYADSRNGFPAHKQLDGGPVAPRGASVFDSGRRADLDDAAEVEQAGRAYGPVLAKHGGPVANPRVQEAINAFIRPFAQVADRPQLPWEARVADASSINAWTIGGGKLAFNAGLIAMCDHPGELAAVAAHEIGHVDLGHVMRGMRANELLAHAKAGGFTPLGSQAVGGLMSGARPEGLTGYDLLLAGYSRTDEYEADEHAVEIMRRAGMDPVWAVSMMNKLARNGLIRGHHLVSDLVQDHPPAVERAENLKRFVGSERPRSDGLVPPGWDTLKSAYPTPAQWRNA